MHAGVHLIEDIFTGYNYATGLVPNWSSLRLLNGAVLTTSKFNDDAAAPSGGVVMFYVTGLLSICDTCRVDASALGWSGGAVRCELLFCLHLSAHAHVPGQIPANWIWRQRAAGLWYDFMRVRCIISRVQALDLEAALADLVRACMQCV